MATKTSARDVVSILKDQHEQIKALFAQVAASSGDERQEEFDHLRALLAVHEAAEEMVVRPITRSSVPGGGDIADARMSEENEAKKALAELESLDCDSAAFAEKLTALKEDVIAHAQNEERQEFSALQQNVSGDDLVRMGKAVKQAEKMAPTHPHPKVKSTAAVYLTGPYTAMMDRVRDAMRG